MTRECPAAGPPLRPTLAHGGRADERGRMATGGVGCGRCPRAGTGGAVPCGGAERELRQGEGGRGAGTRGDGKPERPRRDRERGPGAQPGGVRAVPVAATPDPAGRGADGNVFLDTKLL